MRKILLASLFVVALILSGCTSTSPALKDAVLQNMFTQSAEGKTVLKLSIDHSMQEQLEAEAGEYIEYVDTLLSVLESGIVFDYKGSVSGDFYFKVSLVDSEPIKSLPVWPGSDLEPSFEMIFKSDGQLYFRIASEENWIVQALPEEDAALLEEYGDLSQQIRQFYMEHVNAFVSQFDYDLRSIEDKGLVSYETPEGEIDARHLVVELTLDDAISFASALVESLAEYDGWEAFLKGIDQLLSESVDSEPITDEQIDAEITSLKETLAQLQPVLSMVNEEFIEAQLGADIDFLIKNDLFVTPEANIVGNDMTLQFGVKDQATGEYVDVTLTVESDTWNVNEEVDIEAPENVWTIEEIVALGESGQLPENSIFQLLQSSTRSGELTIGSELLLVSETNDLLGNVTNTILLEAPPYVTEKGNTMVPVKAISDIAGTEAAWNNETKEAAFAIGDQEVRVKLNSNIAYVNGAEVEMPEEVVIVNARTFVPLRFVSENLGADVTWNQQLKTIGIQF